MCSDGCEYEYGFGSGVKGPPLFKLFKVYGTWQLASPNSALYSKEEKPEVMNKKQGKTFL